MLNDILGLSTKPKGGHTKRVKDMVRKAWSIPENVIIMVSELRCHEEGCPDVETVIALMHEEAEPEKVKIYKPMAELNLEEIKSHRPI
ncbi:hypothetical protein OAI47_02625 [Rhodospirillaceae bacterium]|nr:hypothetical protein [Rhodospirillaceae bacterium]